MHQNADIDRWLDDIATALETAHDLARRLQQPELVDRIDAARQRAEHLRARRPG